ncbi:hypothetical protein QQ045_007434 [Rhodiola kirilowii]
MIDAVAAPGIEESSDPNVGRSAYQVLLENTPRPSHGRSRGRDFFQGQARHPAERHSFAEQYLGETLEDGLKSDGVYQPRPRSEPIFPTGHPGGKASQPRPWGETARTRPETSVDAYRERFEALSSGMAGMTNEALMGNFMKGLKAQIHEGVRVLRPRGLEEAMHLVQLIEDKKGAERSSQRAGPSPRLPRTEPSTGGAREKAREPAGGDSTYRKMTEADVESRRARGLCYRCDERWMLGHKCMAVGLKVILVGEDDSDDEDFCSEEDPKAGSNLGLIEVSLNSLSGLTPTRSMKLKGRIAGRDVLVLVDSGATHNFISKDLVEDAVEESRGVCPNISLELPGYTCGADFLPIRMRGTDAILGWQWVQSLGDVKTNWRSLHMEFMDGDKPVTLFGEVGLCKAEVTFGALAHGRKNIDECYLVALATKPLATEDSEVPEPISQVLHQLGDIFHTPTGLPPMRGHEHSIVLQDGAMPISVRPYRYAQA